MFEEHEGAYLIGAYRGADQQDGEDWISSAAWTSRSSAACHGLRGRGKESESPRSRLANYVGVTSERGTIAPKARIAVSPICGGVDVIFAAAGASGLECSIARR